MMNGDPEYLPNSSSQIDKLLQNATQEKVFTTCTDELLKSLMEGYNAACMAYGQTGAGKTFTVSGARGGNFAQRGIIPRSISRVFSEVSCRPENIVTIRLSYIEIYNEMIFDLLHRTPVKDQKGDLIVQEGTKGEIVRRRPERGPHRPGGNQGRNRR